jgi:DNA-binding transcriptional ArsR family regulator
MMRGDYIELIKNAIKDDFLNANEIEIATGVKLNTVNATLRKLRKLEEVDIEIRVNRPWGKSVKFHKLKGDEMRVSVDHYLEMLRFCHDEYKSVSEIYEHLGLLKPVTAKHLVKLYDEGLMESQLLKDGFRGSGQRMYKSNLGWSEDAVRKAFKQVIKTGDKVAKESKDYYCKQTTVNGVTRVVFGNKHPQYEKSKNPRYGVGMGKMGMV